MAFHRERLACLYDVGKSQTLTHFGEAYVLINGAHVQMTNKNSLTQPSYQNTFISDRVSKHNSQAVALYRAFSLITLAEHLNQKETGHCLTGFSRISRLYCWHIYMQFILPIGVRISTSIRHMSGLGTAEFCQTSRDYSY